MNVVHDLSALERRPRAVAIGWFDGVHAGHRQVIDALRATGHAVTVLTFRSHLRTMLGQWEELLATVQRRTELLEEAGVDEVALIETAAQLQVIGSVDALAAALREIGTEVVAGAPRNAGPAHSDLDGLEAAGLQVMRMEETVSSPEIRRLIREGNVTRGASLLGRPVEIEGIVVEGKGRGRTIGFPTANLAVAPGLLTPPGGVYAGAARGHRAGISVGERRPGPDGEPRVETHLVGFDGDLYGERLVVELWQRLRDERSYADEQALLGQTAVDLARVNAAVRPVQAVEAAPERRGSPAAPQRETRLTPPK